MVKLALIGAGLIGGIHLDRMKQIPEIEVGYILDKDFAKADSLAKTCGAKAVNSVDEILKDKSVEGVVHCLPTFERLSFLEKYVKADKHIFCEKPLARTFEEGEKIHSLLKGYKKKVYFGHVVRHFWEYKTARDIISSGELGTPGIVRLSRCTSFPFGASEWFGDFAKSGGAALDLSIHDFDWLLWTFGKADRISARSVSGSGAKYVDYVLAVIHFKNGVIAHVEGSWAEQPGTFYTTYEISGSEGLLEYDMRAQSPLMFKPKEPGSKIVTTATLPENPTKNDPYLVQMKHFVDCITNNQKPAIGVADAFEALKLSLYAIKSIEMNGEIIKIK